MPPKRNPLSEEALDALDPYAPDPKYGKRRSRERRVKDSVVTHDPIVILRAARREDFWLSAAAFGDGPVDSTGVTFASFLEALGILCQDAPHDRRHRYSRCRRVPDLAKDGPA